MGDVIEYQIRVRDSSGSEYNSDWTPHLPITQLIHPTLEVHSRILEGAITAGETQVYYVPNDSSYYNLYLNFQDNAYGGYSLAGRMYYYGYSTGSIDNGNTSVTANQQPMYLIVAGDTASAEGSYSIEVNGSY